MDFFKYDILENDANRRLDRIIKKFLPNLSLSGIYSNLRKKNIKLNGKKANHKMLVEIGDTLEIASFLLEYTANNQKSQVDVNQVKLNVILHDSDFLIINKDENQIVHGKNSLDTYIKQKFPQKDSLSFTIGPLHRLDKDTTGILVFSQSLKGAQEFSKMLQNNEIERFYLGIVIGKLSKTLWETKNTDGKICSTTVTPIHYFSDENLTFAEFQLHTGRKHQIRQQCQIFNTPLLGDTKFGSPKCNHRYLLHCYKLTLKVHVLDLPTEIIAPLPTRFEKFLKERNYNYKLSN